MICGALQWNQQIYGVKEKKPHALISLDTKPIETIQRFTVKTLTRNQP